MAEKFDVCVIGAGSGGLTVAAGSAMLGQKTVLIEKGLMGGDCLNYGCVPSKALLAAAHMAAAQRLAAPFGIEPADPKIDFTQVRAHVESVIAAIAPQDSVERFEGLGVDVIQGHGHFTGPKTAAAAGREISARRFVIATGSSPFIPPIPGLDQVDYFTNETIFANDRFLPHLVIIGGGPIGMEMAQAHRRLGCQVTVIEMATMLAKDDPEASRVVTAALRKEGVSLRAEHQVTAVRASDLGVVVTAKDRSGQDVEIAGSHLLVAVGRKPNVDDLGLKAAGVNHKPHGIEVDNRLRTSNKRIFAIGDVTGGLQFTHVAAYQAGIVIQNALFRLPGKVKLHSVPWVTYTDPELAHVGLTETQAIETHGEIEILRWPLAENDRAQAERRTDGFAKVITTKKGHVLGATIVGKLGGELILPWVLAIQNKLKISKMAAAIAPYPTFSEIGKRAAGSYYTPRLFNDRTRRLVRWLAKLG